MRDIDERTDIRGAPGKLAKLTLMALIMTGGSLWLALGHGTGSSFEAFVGWIGLIFFGAFGVLIVLRLVNALGTVTPSTARAIWIGACRNCRSRGRRSRISASGPRTASASWC